MIPDFVFLSDYLKERFNGKIAKICINGGFSCPNRENGTGGCLFCTDEGAGEFAGRANEPISVQIEKGRRTMDRKWNNRGYIAYFQNFTNTYAPVRELKDKYDEAIAYEEVKGLAIATRPDCIPPDVLELLRHYNERTFLWVELGLQTSSDKTAALINRGYANSEFERAASVLKDSGIRFVVHLIAGLPGESKDDFLDSVRFINNIRPWGIKIHCIYIQSNSPLYDFSLKTGFQPPEMDEFVDWVTDALVLLDKEIIIHRLTGDPDRNKLVMPMWQKDKLRVLSEIKRVYGLKAGIS